MDGMKQCRRCKRTLPLTSFTRHNNTKDGYKNVCSNCIQRKGEVKKDKAPKYKWICLYDNIGCTKANTYGICCHECDKKDSCEIVCKNTPEKCGAYKNG